MGSTQTRICDAIKGNEPKKVVEAFKELGEIAKKPSKRDKIQWNSVLVAIQSRLTNYDAGIPAVSATATAIAEVANVVYLFTRSSSRAWES